MRPLLGVGVGLLCSVITYVALAQESAPWQPASPGSKFEYIPRGREIIADVNGFDVSVSAGRKSFKRYALVFRETGDTRGADHDALEALWPLEVGKQASFSFERNRARRVEYNVAGIETVTVPAGTFDTFVIEETERTIGGRGKSERKQTYWYSPEIGYIVKRVLSVISGKNAGLKRTWDLLEYNIRK